MVVVDAGGQPKTASDSGEREFATVNPATGELVRRFPFLPGEQVDAVVEAAHAAFLSWGRWPVAERAGVVRRAGDLMAERAEELGRLVTLEMGKPTAEASMEAPWVAGMLHYFADQGPGFLEPEPLPVDEGEAVLVHAPLGVLLGIQPWNFPLYQVVRFAAPNLVAGNTVLLKHSELCPQTALALEQLFRDAGTPAGVYTNVFLRTGDVERVVAHPAVQGVSVTGSERAGSSVAALAGRHLTKTVLELGGSDPLIVLDAEGGGGLEATVAAAAAGRLGNTGQSCVASKRIIVVEELYEDFVAALGECFAGLVPGDPTDPATVLGPLSSERAAVDLTAQVRDAVEKGATVVTGGGRPDRPGAFVDATVLTGVTPGMRAWSEELFGPVAVVHRVADDDAAVRLANDSPFGLGASVFCGDPRRARAVADRLECGMVWINRTTGSEAATPFGGVKRSGYGRELSRLGMHEFTNRKLVRTYPAAG